MSTASPPSRTRAMIAATLSLTSVDCSRFKASRALKRSSKSAPPLLSHRAMARGPLRAALAALAARAGLLPAARVLRLNARPPLGAEIGHFGLDAFDLELDRSIAGEGQRHMAPGRIVRFEVNCKKRQDPVALPLLEVSKLGAEYAVESERRP